ncbi:hypothetical protein TH25_06090 [Thalassospira profundimaris]|uniref:HAD family hydrolase n=1 Tax=Thalassospira profundimaris TaxID=502049 RepID=A0A367XIL3_9PROT|nr:HAD hydrolase-like protein [Thalassospira profundimaris]RCK52601.1 hypothetical protein TH25_06090 [Thalassospira profundimaris]
MTGARPALDRESAIAAYLKYADRMPGLAPGQLPAETCDVANILAIADQFDLIIFDAFGVLNSGAEAIPGALQAISSLRAQDVELAIITNDASNAPAAIIERHRNRGFDFSLESLVSSAKYIVPMMKRHSDVTRWGVMAPAHWPIDQLPGQAWFLGDDDSDYDTAEGFVLIDSDAWNEKRQRRLETNLANNPRPILVGNPDICAPMGDFLSVESGYFAHLAADACGVMPECVGKPYREVFDDILQRYPDIDPQRVLMVGDTLHTDILGGLAAGIKTLLVTRGGFLDGYDDLAGLYDRAGFWPHFRAPAIGAGLE